MYRHPRVLSVSCLVVSAILLVATLLQVAGPMRTLRPAPGVMVRVRGRRGRWRITEVEDDGDVVLDPVYGPDGEPGRVPGFKFAPGQLEPVP